MAKYGFYRPHKAVDFVDDTPSMTRQEFKDECDVNMLMKRYQKTGVLPMFGVDRQPQYLRLADVPDFHSAMNLLVEAEGAFMRLPAVVRKEFDNDAVRFVEFAELPESIEQLRKWGLAPPPEVVEAPPVGSPPAASPAAPAAPAAPTQ